MLKATFLRNYRKPETGNTVYVYVVSGSTEDLAAYAEAQGENHKVDEDSGDVLWFNPRFVGDEINLGISRNGKVFADTSEFDKAASLCDQYKDTALGEHLGRVMAEKLLASLGNKRTSAPAPAPKPQDTDEQL